MDPSQCSPSVLPSIHKFRLRVSHAEGLAFKDGSDPKKKKYTSKWRVVIIGDDGKKKATPIISSSTGNPRWDTQLDIKCHPQKVKKPTTLLVIDSEDHHVGQIFIHATDDISAIPLPGVDPLGIWLRKCQELEPTKKNSYPQGRLYYWAWALEYDNDSSADKKTNSNFLSSLSHVSSISSRDLRSVPPCSQSLYSLSPQLSVRANSQRDPQAKSKEEKSWKFSLMHLAHIGNKKKSQKKSKNQVPIMDIPSGSEDSLDHEWSSPPTKEMSFFGGDFNVKKEQSEQQLVSQEFAQNEESKKSSLSSTQQEQSPVKNEVHTTNRGLLMLEPSQGSIHGGYSVTINSYICPLFKTPNDVLSVHVDSICVSENFIQWLDPYVLRILEMPPVREPCRCIVSVETRSRGVIHCQQPFIYTEPTTSTLMKLPVLPNEPTRSLKSEPNLFGSKLSRCGSLNEGGFPISKDPYFSDRESPFLNAQTSVEAPESVSCNVPSKRAKAEFIVGSKGSNKGPQGAASLASATGGLAESALPSSSIKALASATLMGTFSSRKAPEERIEIMHVEIQALREKNTNLLRINQELEDLVRQKESNVLELSQVLCALRNRLLSDNLIDYLEVQK